VGHLTANTEQLLPLALDHATVYNAHEDPLGNLWIQQTAHGLERFTRSSSQTPGGTVGIYVESAKAISGETISGVIDDQEGSIWSWNADGLNQLRNIPFTTVELSKTTGRMALTAGDNSQPILVAADQLYDLGSGQAKPLTKPLHAKGAPPFHNIVRCLNRRQDRSVWIETEDSLLKYWRGKLEAQALSLVPGVSRYSIHTITEDDQERLWISVVRQGLFRFHGTVWQKMSGHNGLPDDQAVSAFRDHDGKAWFGWLDGRIARITGDHAQIMGRQEGLDIGAVKAFTESGGRFWVAGDQGVAVRDGSRFRTIIPAAGQQFLGVTGLAVSPDQSLWINGSNGVFRVSKEELARNEAEPSYAVAFQRFDYLDGVVGLPSPIVGLSSLVSSADGGLYVATRNNLQWIDTAHIPHNSIAPSVLVTSVRVGNQDFVRPGTPIRLQPNAANVQISYSASSLLIPERVRFRYQLVGYDKDWVDAGTRHQAFYTKLPAGKYTFLVIACNDSGVWSPSGASVVLTVLPTLIETFWFRLCISLTMAAILYLGFILRMRSLQRSLEERLQERFFERERIARDLHDTLFQGVEGGLLHINAVISRLTMESEAKEKLRVAFSDINEVMASSRNLIFNQTKSSEPIEFEQMIQGYGEQIGVLSEIRFKVSVSGRKREIKPQICEELLKIVKESVSNAFRHANARQIQVQIVYSRSALEVFICDDGVGIDPMILEVGGRQGHGGLPGMRQRAASIGAQFWLSPRERGGTEIRIRVTGNVAFCSQVLCRIARWLGRGKNSRN
jgi:signal transduction histidine kinase